MLRLSAAILDFSGTTIDPYVLAPAQTFVNVFEKKGVKISFEEARKPMGLRKDLHIQALLEEPSIRERWFARHERYPRQRDLAEMYENFLPLQLGTIREYCRLLPGVKESVDELRKQNIKIGVTTGFTSPITKVILEETAKQGFSPDACVAGNEVKFGCRPAPFMLYENLARMGTYPIKSVIKVDDTCTGIEEGINAGCWTVGVYGYSNYLNINSLEEVKNMSSRELRDRRKKSKEILASANPHFLIESMLELPEIVRRLNIFIEKAPYKF